jgi:hypothetical protein
MTSQHLANAKAESPVNEMGTSQSRSMAVSRTEVSTTTITNDDLDLTEENQSRPEYETADDDLLFSEDEKEEPTKDDELNQTVRELFEEEEGVLNMHMTFIAENAKLLSKEGALLQDVQRPNVSDEEIERYASMLEEILDRKEDMIAALQRKLAVFESHLDAK